MQWKATYKIKELKDCSKRPSLTDIPIKVFIAVVNGCVEKLIKYQNNSARFHSVALVYSHEVTEIVV